MLKKKFDNNKNSSKDQWLTLMKSMIDYQMFNEAMRKAVKNENMTAEMIVEYILQTKVQRNSKKDNVDVKFLTNFKEV